MNIRKDQVRTQVNRPSVRSIMQIVTARGVIGVLRGAAISTLLLTGPAHAARPDARTMSCAQAQSLVRSRGAVVLSTGQHTYDRFVATAQFCSSDQVLERTWISTKGRARCDVGYICRQRFRSFGQ